MSEVVRATSVVKPGDWTPDEATARVTLSFDQRFRRRFRMADDTGGEFMLDLAEARRLEDGDGLVLEDGRILLVQAALEDVLDIACTSRGDALRIAWHLGNRHTPVQMLGNGNLRIAYDHVLEQLAEQAGAKTMRRQAPFFPEGELMSPMLTDAGLYRLMTWLSPAFPVGAYAYSHGIEKAIEAGQVRDEATLLEWVEGIIEFGAGRVDATLFAHAWKGADVTALANAFRGTAELALETQQQGAAFAKFVQGIDVAPASYPVVVAMAAAQAEVPLADALVAYVQAFAANLVSAGVRLIPLGPIAGQRLLDDLRETVLAAAQDALTRPLDRLGSAALAVDLVSIQHETQYTRLFRS